MLTAITLLATAMALAVASCGGPAKPVAATTTSTSSSSTSSTSSTTTEPPEPVITNAYTFTCTEFSTDETAYNTLADVWKAQAGDCYTDIDPAYTPSKIEAAAAAALIKAEKYYGEDGPTGALAELMNVCAESGVSAEELLQDSLNDIPYVLRLCPRAPHARLMRAVAAGDYFEDGDQTVGKDVKPGTYRTTDRASDCYWERSTKGGDTVANDFVKNAPGGVTVTIRSTDGGFSSQGCGTWKRVQ